MTKTQKKELKNRFFKILHIVSYALSIIFIIVLIVSMVQSCGNSKKTEVTSSQPNNALPLLSEPKRAPVTNDNNYYNYVLLGNNYDTWDFSLTDQYDISLYSVNLNTAYGSAQPHKNVTLYQYNSEYESFAYFMDEDGAYRNLKNIIAGYDTYLSSDNNYYYRLTGVSIDTIEGGYGEEVLVKRYFNGGDLPYPADNFSYTWGDDAYYIALSNTSYFDNVGTRQLWRYDVTMNNFSFASQINYYGAFGSSPNEQYLSTYTTDIDTYTIWTPSFICAGKIYNGIKLYYEDAINKSYEPTFNIADPTKMVTLMFQGYKTYTKMSYLLADGSGDELVVNVRDTGIYETDDGTALTYYKASSSWVNYSYRYIKFGWSIDADVLEQLNAINQDYSGAGTIIYGDYNVFTLIGSAFESWVTILGVSLLPGITIGTLLFLPLVVIVIFAIIKVIKK